MLGPFPKRCQRRHYLVKQRNPMEKKKRGRPMIEIDADKVEMLASFGCSTVEIAKIHN